MRATPLDDIGGVDVGPLLIGMRKRDGASVAEPVDDDRGRVRLQPLGRDRGLPMQMPEYISDVRIENGKITLYKSVK